MRMFNFKLCSFGLKVQICLLKEKFATLINWNMQNSIAVFFASVLGWKHAFGQV